MAFRDLHEIETMFRQFDGYAAYEQRCFDVHQWRLQQRRQGARREPRDHVYKLAYQREWQRQRRATPEGREAKRAHNTTHYERLKADEGRWRKRLDCIAAWKAAKRAARRSP